MTTDSGTISDVRLQATPTYHVEFLTVGNHTTVTVDTNGIWIERPIDPLGRYSATCIKLQTIGQNIRYTIDTNPATSTHGFQLVAGADVLIPVPNNGLSVVAENTLATIEYQWVR